MGTKTKKQRRKVRQALQEQAVGCAQDYNLLLEYEIQQALVSLEGEVPAVETISEHAERYKDEHDNEVFFWKGEHVLTVSKPIMLEGKMKCGVERHYQAET